MEVSKTNTLSFYNDQGVLTLSAKQYDTGRKFIFNIINDYELCDLTGYSVYLRMRKADKTEFQGEECCSIDGSKVIVDTSVSNGDQILSCPGMNLCELHLTDSNGKSVTTWNFIINVEARVHNGDGILSKNSWDMMDTIESTVKDFNKKLDEHYFVFTSDKDIANGVPSLDANKKIPSDELPVASTTLGGVKSGTDITVDVDGNVSVNDDSHKHKLNNISDVTATASELNVLDGITASTTELNYTDGVKSNIQDQLDDKAPLASPELTGMPKAPTASAGTNTTQIATTAFVQTAVSEGIAASDALRFCGTLGTTGTITALPTTYKTGWTYRVVTDGTYAGQECEIGDLIIALIDREDTGNLDSDWCVAQTNIDGAITGIKSGDAYIEISQTGSVVTIKHKDVARTNTTSTANLSHGDTFTAVKSVTSDDKGHVTGVETETVTLPTYKAGNNVTFTPNVDNDEITIKSSHESITTGTDTTSTASPSAGGTFTTVDSVTRDSNGHVTKVNTKTVTLPSTSVTVDSALSSTSTNPVQNKVVNSALGTKIGSSDSITFDDTTSTYSTLSDANTAAETSIGNIKTGNSIVSFFKNAKQSFSAIIQGLKILGTNVGAISGITDSLTATSSNVALSANGGNNLQGQINTLNSNLNALLPTGWKIIFKSFTFSSDVTPEYFDLETTYKSIPNVLSARIGETNVINDIHIKGIYSQSDCKTIKVTRDSASSYANTPIVFVLLVKE